MVPLTTTPGEVQWETSKGVLFDLEMIQLGDNTEYIPLRDKNAFICKLRLNCSHSMLTNFEIDPVARSKTRPMEEQLGLLVLGTTIPLLQQLSL